MSTPRPMVVTARGLSRTMIHGPGGSDDAVRLTPTATGDPQWLRAKYALTGAARVGVLIRQATAAPAAVTVRVWQIEPDRRALIWARADAGWETPIDEQWHLDPLGAAWVYVDGDFEIEVAVIGDAPVDLAVELAFGLHPSAATPRRWELD